jgi:hypothetical protein
MDAALAKTFEDCLAVSSSIQEFIGPEQGC